MLVIGIAGGSAVGKSTVAEQMRKQLGGNVAVVSLGDYLRELYKNPEKSPIPVEKKENPTKEELAELGNRIREEFCDGILVKWVAKEYSEKNYSVLIIEGIRTIAEASQLLTLDPSKFKPFLIYVTANKNVRKERWKTRGTKGSFEKIYQMERKLWKTHLIRKIADYVIVNNGNLGQLQREVVDAVDVLREKVTANI